MRECPFKNALCNDSCALYIKSNELNELVINRLKSLGVFTCNSDGICSLKSMALAQSRFIFENTKVFNK